MLELGSYETEGHRLVGRRAAAVVDVLLTVGRLGGSIGEEALAMGLSAQNLHILPNHRDAIDILRRIVRPGDLVLVKGSRAVGMDAIVAEITGEAAGVTDNNALTDAQEPADG